MNCDTINPHDTVLEISLSCEGVQRPKSTTGPDAFVVVYTRDHDLDDWTCVGYTESVPSSFIPRFQRTFKVKYDFATRQSLLFRVHDFDFVSDPSDIGNHALLGSCQADLSSLLKGNTGNTTRLLLDTTGFVAVSLRIPQDDSEATRHMANYVSLVVTAQRLRSLTHNGACDPRMVIYGLLPGNSGLGKKLLYKSEVVKGCIVPSWQSVAISLATLRVGLPDEESLLFEIYDNDACGDSLIGTTIVSVRALQCSPTDVPLGGIDGRVNGALRIYSQMTHVPTFFEQLQLGFRLDMIFVVDFGEHVSISDPHCQHHLQSVAPNAFVKIMTHLGQHVRHYLTHSRMRALGCGIVNSEDVSTPVDVYPFLCDSSNHHSGLLSCVSPEICNEVRQVLRDYEFTLPRVTRAKYTKLAPVVRSASCLARASPRSFTLVPIITYGEIEDIDELIEAVLDAQLDPVSFLIIDLGNTGALSELFRREGECIPLTSRRDGRVLRRQLVSCISYRLFSHSMSQFTKEVMHQVPAMCAQWGIHTGVLTNMQS